MAKRILITGAGSYIGASFAAWLERQGGYAVSVSMRDGAWRNADFTRCDAVVHAAGIAHIKETRRNAALYYEINRDLAYEVASVAKKQGVGQFVMLSSMSVYGQAAGAIGKDTVPAPVTHYGKSKLEGERLVLALAAPDFKIAIVRPPMVYGKGCKGNYAALSRLAKKLPVFPGVSNRRSMIFIDNLCEHIRLLVEEEQTGMFCPQNAEYVCTADMVRLIAETGGRHVWLPKFFNPLIARARLPLTGKIFGDLYYSKDLSGDTSRYCVADFETGVRLSEAP